uniref:Uncharacterized protein n=1 Tax=Ignisphaera aggregans TaxID=334771 RepID=A0A7J2U5F3_9CREN
MKYARICIEISKGLVQIELYNNEGLQLEDKTYSNVRFVEVKGIVRLDLESMKLNKDILCIFSEKVDGILFTEGALKIG